MSCLVGRPDSSSHRQQVSSSHQKPLGVLAEFIVGRCAAPSIDELKTSPTEDSLTRSESNHTWTFSSTFPSSQASKSNLGLKNPHWTHCLFFVRCRVILLINCAHFDDWSQLLFIGEDVLLLVWEFPFTNSLVCLNSSFVDRPRLGPLSAHKYDALFSAVIGPSSEIISPNWFYTLCSLC